MDFADMSDDDLDALRVNVLIEQERRATIANAEQQADELAARYASAIGRADGDEWAQPAGAFDAYPLGATVKHDGKTWESLIAANVWEPGVSSWREQTSDDAPADWVAPTGAHDAYQTGDLVTFDGAVYRSVIDGNTWSPSAYPQGWELVE